MLTGKQRSYLKAMAHNIDPIVSIGKSDLTESIIKAIDDNLSARELIKVSIQDGSLLDPKETANEVAEQLGAEFVQAIGRRFVLYRMAKDPKKRKIDLRTIGSNASKAKPARAAKPKRMRGAR